MGDEIDYYNLLQDTLRSSYLQVVKIYSRLADARHSYRFINIRTGYPMKFRKHNSNYLYNDNEIYPICWNFQAGGCTSLAVIRKLFKKYEYWLAEYERTNSEEAIRDLVKDEIEEARTKYNIAKENNSTKKQRQFDLDMAKNQSIRNVHMIFSEDEHDSEEEELNEEDKDFINDDSVEYGSLKSIEDLPEDEVQEEEEKDNDEKRNPVDIQLENYNHDNNDEDRNNDGSEKKGETFTHQKRKRAQKIVNDDEENCSGQSECVDINEIIKIGNKNYKPEVDALDENNIEWKENNKCKKLKRGLKNKSSEESSVKRYNMRIRQNKTRQAHN